MSRGSVMSRGRTPTVMRWAGLAIVATVVVGGLVVFNPLVPLLGDDTLEIVAPRAQSEITVSSLSGTIDSEGDLVFTSARDVNAAGPGTLTSVADVGSSITASTVLFEVDGEPTVALIGDVPAWRAMRVDDVGIDVAQLEANLVALGYDPDALMTVDETFTDYTATVVQRWQEDVGVEAGGSVPLGSMAFVPESATVTAVGATVGTSVAGTAGGSGGAEAPVLSVASSERELQFTVATADLDTIGVGTEVTAQLPDRSTVSATVAELAPIGDGEWQAAADLTTVEDGVVLPSGESVPVTVTWTEAVADAATTVRANALTRLDNGTYALEVVGADGSTSFVAVDVGARSGSTVEIITDLPPGTVIIAP